MCSALLVTAGTTFKQEPSWKTDFDPAIPLDSVIPGWEAAELSLNC